MSRLTKLLFIVSKLSAMQTKELWQGGPANYDLIEHWRQKEVRVIILIKNEYEKEV